MSPMNLLEHLTELKETLAEVYCFIMKGNTKDTNEKMQRVSRLGKDRVFP